MLFPPPHNLWYAFSLLLRKFHSLNPFNGNFCEPGRARFGEKNVEFLDLGLLFSLHRHLKYLQLTIRKILVWNNQEGNINYWWFWRLVDGWSVACFPKVFKKAFPTLLTGRCIPWMVYSVELVIPTSGMQASPQLETAYFRDCPNILSCRYF